MINYASNKEVVFYLIINDNHWTSVIIGFRYIKCFSFIVRIVFLILSIVGFNIDCSDAIY